MMITIMDKCKRERVADSAKWELSSNNLWSNPPLHEGRAFQDKQQLGWLIKHKIFLTFASFLPHVNFILLLSVYFLFLWSNLGLLAYLLTKRSGQINSYKMIQWAVYNTETKRNVKGVWQQQLVHCQFCDGTATSILRLRHSWESQYVCFVLK